MHPWQSPPKPGPAQDSGLFHTHHSIPSGLMLEDKGDWGPEVLSVFVGDTADMTSDSRGCGRFPAANPCVSHVELSVPQHPGPEGPQLGSVHPWSGQEAHHSKTCRTRLRLTSCSARKDLFFNRWTISLSSPYPTIPFKLQYPICHILGHLDTQWGRLTCCLSHYLSHQDHALWSQVSIIFV